MALAEILGVNQWFVTKYESGERRLHLIQLRHICTALEIKLPVFAAEFDD